MFLYLNPRAFRCLSAPSFFVVPSMWRLSSTTAATVARPQLQLPSKQAADGHWKPKGGRNSPNIYIWYYIYNYIYNYICWRTSKMGTGRWGNGKRYLPHDMGLPRWELAGGEMGGGIIILNIYIWYYIYIIYDFIYNYMCWRTYDT